jgi:uncharacterized protein YecE (DUF72 family)
VEVRPTFWDDSISVSDVKGWVSAVSGNRRFEFGLKLHSSFTHKKSITPRDTKGVRSLLHELGKHNRLAGLIAQFPYSFTNTGANRFHLAKLSEVFSGFPLFVELRHTTWDTPGLPDFLSEHNVHSVNVDIPRLRQYMPFRSDVVGNVAYVRLHGRNEKGWLLNSMDLRYDYLYNAREIRELKGKLTRLAERSKRVYTVFNNMSGGKGMANAFQMKHALGQGRPMIIPSKTVRSFHFLSEIAQKESGQTTIPVNAGLRHVI